MNGDEIKLQGATFKFKLLTPYSRLPKRAHENDTGFDAYTIDEAWIKAGETRLLSLGIACECPYGLALVLRPRSGLSAHGILAHTGTIDNGYRGEIKCAVTNLNSVPLHLEVGDRVCQLVPECVLEVQAVAVDELDTDTDRGESGFGSTGR